MTNVIYLNPKKKDGAIKKPEELQIAILKEKCLGMRDFAALREITLDQLLLLTTQQCKHGNTAANLIFYLITTGLTWIPSHTNYSKRAANQTEANYHASRIINQMNTDLLSEPPLSKLDNRTFLKRIHEIRKYDFSMDLLDEDVAKIVSAEENPQTTAAFRGMLEVINTNIAKRLNEIEMGGGRER